MAGTPSLSTLSKLYYASTLYGDRTQIAYVQEIPKLESAPEATTYSALDIKDERQAKGRKKAEETEISILYTETQHLALKAIDNADTEMYWFVQLPESAAETEGKPLTFSFAGSCAIGLDTIAIDDMLKDILTIYRSTAVTETTGFPVQPTT